MLDFIDHLSHYFLGEERGTGWGLPDGGVSWALLKTDGAHLCSSKTLCLYVSCSVSSSLKIFMN